MYINVRIFEEAEMGRVIVVLATTARAFLRLVVLKPELK